MKARLPQWWRWWALMLGLSAVLLPFLALIPLGGLWLWQQGWLLVWLAAAVAVSAAGAGYAQWLRYRARRNRAHWDSQGSDAPVSAPDSDWSPDDLAAWQQVMARATEADRALITDYRLMLAEARATIETVAHHYHPEQRNPLWRFTLPEALLLSERVSHRLRLVVLDHVPASHLIHAGDVLRLWSYKSRAEQGLRTVQRMTWVYRLLRFANPAGALLAELAPVAPAAGG